MAIYNKRLLPEVVNTIKTEEKAEDTPAMTIASRNQDKIREYSRILNKEIIGIDLKVSEIQSEDPMTVFSEKAKAAWHANNGEPIIVEDSSLMCKGIEGMPGPFIDQFSNNLTKREALCKMLDGKDRSAVFQVILGLFDGRDVHYRVGRILGSIAEKPIGLDGFGFDDIFIPAGHKKTYAQMSVELKDKNSPRRIALLELAKKPFAMGKNVYLLPEPYSLQSKMLDVNKLSGNKKALAFAYSLEQFVTSKPHADFSVNKRKQFEEISYAEGQVKQYVADKNSASVGLILTPWDTALDLHKRPRRIRVNDYNHPVFWQMGDEATKVALAARAYEFSLNHNEQMYSYIRDIMSGKVKAIKRPKNRSVVIEEMLKIRKKDSWYPSKEEEIEVFGTAASREVGYARMYTDDYMSRTKSANSGLILNSTGIPSSLFSLGGMPPVTGWADVLVTAALSYMRCYIPRNSVFAGNLNRQLKLFNQAKDTISSLKLPIDIYELILKQIGIAVGVESPKELAETTKKILKSGCSLMRIYTTNPDPRVIEAAKAIRQAAGSNMTICVGPIVDVKQARRLIHPDIDVNILLAGHGGGENCTSLSGGGTANALELLYEMYLDPDFDDVAIGLEGGTGDEIGALLGLLDVISLNRRGVAGGIETGGLFVEHVNGRPVQPYHGSASSVTQWIEAALNPDIAKKRLNEAGRLKNIEGILNYIVKKHSTHSIVELFWERRMFAGRALADQGSRSIFELRQKIAERGHINHRSVTMEAAYIAGAHRSI